MRVLVAGASGAIGRRLVPQLQEAGHTVIGITRRPGSLAGTGAEELIADVSNRAELLERVADLRADAVVHQLTALKRPPLTFRDMRATNRLRQEGTSTLLAVARRVGAERFIAASIFYGYGFQDHGRRPIEESAAFGEPERDNDPVQVALQSLEQQVRGFGGISLRYGLIYEPDARAVSPVPARWRGLVPQLHVEDAASAVVSALASDASGEFNIADDNPMTYRDRETAIARARDLRAPLPVPEGILRVAAPFGSQLLTRTNLRVSTDKARSELGWRATYPSLVAALARPTQQVSSQAPKLAQ